MPFETVGEPAGLCPVPGLPQGTDMPRMVYDVRADTHAGNHSHIWSTLKQIFKNFMAFNGETRPQDCNSRVRLPAASLARRQLAGAQADSSVTGGTSPGEGGRNQAAIQRP